MRTTDEYQQMTSLEKTEFIGKLLHACQSDNDIMKAAFGLIEIGERRGLFDNVKIMPDTKECLTNIENTKIKYPDGKE